MIARAALVAALAAGLISPASAQSGNPAYPRSDGGRFTSALNYLTRTSTDGYFNAKDWNDEQRGPQRECLDHKKTGRTYCLTRGQWAAVAAGTLKLTD